MATGTRRWDSRHRCALSRGEETRAWTARTHPPSAQGSPPSIRVAGHGPEDSTVDRPPAVC